MFVCSNEVGGAKRLGQASCAFVLSTFLAGTSTQGFVTAASTWNETLYAN